MLWFKGWTGAFNKLVIKTPAITSPYYHHTGLIKRRRYRQRRDKPKVRGFAREVMMSVHSLLQAAVPREVTLLYGISRRLASQLPESRDTASAESLLCDMPGSPRAKKPPRSGGVPRMMSKVPRSCWAHTHSDAVELARRLLPAQAHPPSKMSSSKHTQDAMERSTTSSWSTPSWTGLRRPNSIPSARISSRPWRSGCSRAWREHCPGGRDRDRRHPGQDGPCDASSPPRSSIPSR